jgi:hypothetical protein
LVERTCHVDFQRCSLVEPTFHVDFRRGAVPAAD